MCLTPKDVVLLSGGREREIVGRTNGCLYMREVIEFDAEWWGQSMHKAKDRERELTLQSINIKIDNGVFKNIFYKQGFYIGFLIKN